MARFSLPFVGENQKMNKHFWVMKNAFILDIIATIWTQSIHSAICLFHWPGLVEWVEKRLNLTDLDAFSETEFNLTTKINI